MKARLLAVGLTLGMTGSSLFTSTTMTSAAEDTPGTQITNNAQATYKDASGNSYTTQSNTVTTQVQNAPVFTITSPGLVNYVDSQAASDVFTLSNTGNASGTFAVPSAATISATGTLGGTYTGCAGTMQYVVLPASGSTCFSSLSTLQTYLTANAVASGGSMQIAVVYTVNAAASPGTGNLSSTLGVTLTYPTLSGAPSETTGTQSATPLNNITADPSLNLYKASAQNGGTGVITYNIYAINGGGAAAKDLNSAKTLLGAAAAGVFISDKVPQFAGAPLDLANSGTVTTTDNTTYGYPTAGTPAIAIYYSTSATGASWIKASGNLPTNGTVYYIGIYLSGGSCTGYGSGYELCADPGAGTSPGNADVAAASAVGFSFQIVQPTGNGSGDAGAVTNLANAVVGDPLGNIIGPGIPAGTADGGSLIAAGEGINNTTPSVSPGSPLPGASNQTSNAALSSYSLLNGPLGYQGSSGSYDGVVAANNNDDFTAWGITAGSGDNVINTSTTVGTPATTATTGSAFTVCVPHTLQNTGNSQQSFNITANIPNAYPIPATSGGTAVTGWKVGIYSDALCSTVLGGGADASPSSTATSVGPLTSNPQQTMTYYVKYSVPAGVPYFERFDASITAAVTASPATTNLTHDELYSGFVALTKTTSINNAACPGGLTPTFPATGLCSGSLLTYTVDYRNLVMGTTDNTQTFSDVETEAGTFGITDDGSQTAVSSTTVPNWATFTSWGAGSVAPADHNDGGTTRAASTYQYYAGVPASGGALGSFGATVSKFICTVGGTTFQLVPKNFFGTALPTAALDWQGTMTFTVLVK